MMMMKQLMILVDIFEKHVINKISMVINSPGLTVPASSERVLEKYRLDLNSREYIIDR